MLFDPATVAALPQEQVLRLVPQEQVLRLVDEAKTNRFQFQKTSVTDNTKPQGDLDSVSVEFCQPRTRFGFWTLHQRHVGVKLNNYWSFHRETGVGVGALLTDIDTDFLAKLEENLHCLTHLILINKRQVFQELWSLKWWQVYVKFPPPLPFRQRSGEPPVFERVRRALHKFCLWRVKVGKYSTIYLFLS